MLQYRNKYKKTFLPLTFFENLNFENNDTCLILPIWLCMTNGSEVKYSYLPNNHVGIDKRVVSK